MKVPRAAHNALALLLSRRPRIEAAAPLRELGDGQPLGGPRCATGVTTLVVIGAKALRPHAQRATLRNLLSRFRLVTGDAGVIERAFDAEGFPNAEEAVSHEASVGARCRTSVPRHDHRFAAPPPKLPLPLSC